MNRKLYTLLTLSLILSSSTLAQKQKVDTVYLDREGAVVDPSKEFLTYLIRPLDRKKRIIGIAKRYAKNGRLLETFTYKKGVKEGLYQRFHRNGNLMMEGKFKDDNRSDFWVFYDQEQSITKLEEYDALGKLLQTRDRPFPVKKDKASADSLRISVETSPEFPGGMDNWNAHLRKHLKYPTAAKRYGRGEVKISFVVLSDGRIVLPKVIESTHPSLGQEGIRVINLSPRWNPAELDGKPVDATMNLRITFRAF
ncbi:energy transducer TonB [Roseivirga sp.]|uniref:energy transducer TonB n=1 Tax=Roseivirga sp. TaxID=1964215 RepID=UPI003B8CA39A